MCMTWCHRRQILYWNHEDCHPVDCPQVNEKHGRCDDCRHRLEEAERVWCGLTRTALPAQGGCCHWNVEIGQGPQEVTRETLVLFEPSPLEPEVFVLVRQEVSYQSDGSGRVYVDPDELGLPYTYGLGTDCLPEEGWDWPQWDGSLEA